MAENKAPPEEVQRPVSDAQKRAWLRRVGVASVTRKATRKKMKVPSPAQKDLFDT